MRRMSLEEEKACRIMASARLADGEHADDTTPAIARYLVAKGWSGKAAQGRATDLVREELARKDGIAGAGATYI